MSGTCIRYICILVLLLIGACDRDNTTKSISEVHGNRAHAKPLIAPIPDLGRISAFQYPAANKRDPFMPTIHKPLLNAIITQDKKRVSLHLKDIPVKSVLRLFADLVGLNLVISDAVTGKLSLRLQEVPWEEAFQVILSSQGLGKRQMGEVIWIDSAETLAAREHRLLEESLVTRQLAPIHSVLLQINYAKAGDLVHMLKDKSSSLLSSRGTVSLDARTNSIWLRDTEEQIASIRAFLKRLDVPVKQVLIEARIVDMSKDCAQDLGLRFGISKPTQFNGTLAGATQAAQGVPSQNIPMEQRLNLDLGAIPSDGATPASLGIALARLGAGILLDLELSALESTGRAQIIARPRLMTTNQQPAIIESGEDIPYQRSTLSGATAVAFKKAVLSLKVTPHITPDGTLLMDLQITQDADSGQRVQGVPIISTKSVQTNVLVNNGETIVLGGIYMQNKNNTVARIPFLGRLPVVGYLFGRTDVIMKNEELLIFITPRIITSDSRAIARKKLRSQVGFRERS